MVVVARRVEEEFSRALQDAAQLAGVLHPTASVATAESTAHAPTARILDLFRETEAISITLGAVADQIKSLLPLAGARRDRVVGRMHGTHDSGDAVSRRDTTPISAKAGSPKVTSPAMSSDQTLSSETEPIGTASIHTRSGGDKSPPQSPATSVVPLQPGGNDGSLEDSGHLNNNSDTESLHPANGLESILCILVSLLKKLRRAIRQVVQVESNWLSSGLTNLTQMSSIKIASCHDAMQLHHAQLRALYAIFHLTVAIVAKTDTSKTLFLAGSPEFEPQRWRSAVRMEDFHGRGFGFHYKPEMRNLLRAVKIAKGSVDKTASSDITNPLIRNMAIMGWSWVYGHATILNNIGVPIEGIRSIGTDTSSTAAPDIEHVRMFMNLVEDPFVAGVAVLASADASIDRTFAIPPPLGQDLDQKEHGQCRDSPECTPDIHVVGVSQHVRARLISYMLRPTQLPSKRKTQPDHSPSSHPSPNSLLNKHPSLIDDALGGFQTLSEKIDQFLRPESSTLASGLIIHFHGGGFISQSSKSHAFYLREWASDIQDAVILSVDYQLAPEAQYPVALQECVHAYMWAVKNCHRLGSAATRIVLAGDSAGGNLAVAVAMKVAEVGFRKPDGIVLAYPALYLTKGWSPSRLLSFFDPLLPVSVVEACLKWYVPDGADAESDPFLSPCVSTDAMLEALPSVSIASGSLDPLLDDAVFFIHRLRSLGRLDARLRLIESMPHGFLNMSNMSPSAKAEMHNMARWIAQYLEVEFDPRNRGGSRVNPKNAAGSRFAPPS